MLNSLFIYYLFHVHCISLQTNDYKGWVEMFMYGSWSMGLHYIWDMNVEKIVIYNKILFFI